MRRTWMKWSLPLVATLGLVGCGDDTRVYEVDFDAAAMADVPTSCTGFRTGPRKAEGFEAHQTWTLREDEYGGTTLEVPDVSFSLSAEDAFSIDGDREPDVLLGTDASKGPFQFVDMRTQNADSALPIRRTLQFLITDKSLGDTIQGELWLRSEYGADALSTEPEETCISTIPFTGHRVKE